MHKLVRILVGLTLLPLLGLCGCSTQSSSDTSALESGAAAAKTDTESDKGANAMTATDTSTSALDFTVKDIDGNDVALEKYRGKVVLLVNVASKCGLTSQYEDLQRLHQQHADAGLAILAFPADNFLGQEPGTNAEIKQFCRTKYDVGFDLFAKVSVKGRDKCGLYRYLTSKEHNPEFGGELKWNFTKFLLDRDGKIIARFDPRTRPNDPKVVAAIQAALEAGRLGG